MKDNSKLGEYSIYKGYKYSISKYQMEGTLPSGYRGILSMTRGEIKVPGKDNTYITSTGNESDVINTIKEVVDNIA